MKLSTTIQPRRDGTVNFKGPSGAAYTFRDEAGELCADVPDEGDVRAALLLDHFYPTDAKDDEAARALLASARDADQGAGDEDDDLDEVLDADGNPIDPGSALPVEANTPPAAGKKPRKAKA